MNRLKRPFVWLKRIRHRRGYGVHSPSAFDFITNVIYEKAPYYAYAAIEQTPRGKKSAAEPLSRSKKKNRLLLRLVNRAQPSLIVSAGAPSPSADYLRAGKRSAEFISVAGAGELALIAGKTIGFLHIRWNPDPAFAEETWNRCVAGAGERSLFVIEGIHYSAAMRQFWQRCMDDERVGITFDLYDLGILFFDRSKIKQHYIINF